jgi:hypothetical protein
MARMTRMAARLVTPSAIRVIRAIRGYKWIDSAGVAGLQKH